VTVDPSLPNGRHSDGIYPGDDDADSSVGLLGTCQICGKRWVFGPCEHAATGETHP
jgi:hypothetical protein